MINIVFTIYNNRVYKMQRNNKNNKNTSLRVSDVSLKNKQIIGLILIILC